jgi:hypothetical protein
MIFDTKSIEIPDCIATLNPLARDKKGLRLCSILIPSGTIGPGGEEVIYNVLITT